jgi:pSer/pThr/pTyr-binding forkhead associated (FHA) protein
MPFFIKILTAPKPEMAGVKIPLVDGPNLLGRINPPCTILLEGAKVSKKHCSFHVLGPTLTVEDHNSSNGVYVNGKKTSNLELKDRDRIVIGEYVLEVAVK